MIKKIALSISILFTLNSLSQTPAISSSTSAFFDECPDKPNCVISYQSGAKREGQFLEPYKGTGDKNIDMQKIEKILKSKSDVKIVSKTDDRIKAEFTSLIFRFVDDVEFYFGDDNKVHFRSASRVGYSDLGANKKRIEKIRFEFHQTF